MRSRSSRRILNIVVGALAVAIVGFVTVGLIFPDSLPGQLLAGAAIHWPTPMPEPTKAPLLTPEPTHPSASATPRPTMGIEELSPTPSPQPIPVPTVLIEAEWPTRMEVNWSDSVRVSLVRTTEGAYVPTIEVEGHTAVVDTPIPVGTPGQPIEEAFGSGYEAFALARLVGTGFDVESAGPEEQSLEQPTITWEWNITPRQPGHHVLNVSLEACWRPAGDEGQAVMRQVWRARLDVQVVEPLVSKRTLLTLTPISGLLAMAFVVPPLYVARRKKDQTALDFAAIDETSGYNIATVRRLLLDAFTDRELRRFCQERPPFDPLLDHFGSGYSLAEMVDVLIEYCQKRALLPDLLSEIEEYSPKQYQKYQDRL
jgi:hypothetical protein